MFSGVGTFDVVVQSFAAPMDCGPPGSSVHGISQARILEWIAISFSRGIFLTQGLNLCLLSLQHWQVYSLPLSHLGSPVTAIRHGILE